MNEPWNRHLADEHALALQREAANERLARAARPELPRPERQATLLAVPLLGRLWLKVELWSR